MQISSSKNTLRGPALWLPLALLFLIIGTVLLLNASTNFVFYYADGYTKVSLCLVMLLTPAVLFCFRRCPQLIAHLESKYPTHWLRNWVMQPLVAAFIVSMVCTGALGWALTVSEAVTDTMKVMRATAVEVGEYSPGKGCDQVARLNFEGVIKQVCLENMYLPGTLKVGQTLDVTVHAFPFGFLLISMADAAVEAPHAEALLKDEHENY